MKKYTVIFLSIFLSISCFAKDFHFFYIRLDNSIDKDVLNEKINKLKNSLEDKSDFVLYYSNAKVTMDKLSWNQRDLFGLISNQSSSVAFSIFEELDAISVMLEKYLQMEISEDDNGYKKISSKLKYESISFDCFVGNDFFENDLQNALIARMLFANSLNQQNFNVDVYYYPCGANYSDKDIKFDSQYSLNNKTEIVR